MKEIEEWNPLLSHKVSPLIPLFEIVREARGKRKAKVVSSILV